MEKIVEGNRIIAESPFIPNLHKIWINKSSIEQFAQTAKYKTDWAWLMPVVERICKHKFEDGETVYVRTFGMINEDTGAFMVRFNRYGLHEGRDLIDAVYSAVVEFITWYNQQATSTQPN